MVHRAASGDNNQTSTIPLIDATPHTAPHSLGLVDICTRLRISFMHVCEPFSRLGSICGRHHAELGGSRIRIRVYSGQHRRAKQQSNLAGGDAAQWLEGP